METIFYIISISLQLAGALLLMIFVLSTKREKVIQRFAGNGIIARDNNTNEILYNEKAFKDSFKNAYLNKCSFAFIALGYFMGVFGAINYNKALVGILIVLCTGLIMGATYLIVNQIVSHSKVINKKITNEELSLAGVEPDIEDIPNDEIAKLFE